MLEYYIYQGGEKLRCGYTTGSCSAMAAGASARMLLSGRRLASYGLITPKGIEVSSELEDITFGEGYVSCAVRKDGGDDIDATHNLLIYARAEKILNGIEIKGGEGVGVVTKPGLDQPVGEAAINSVPRRMIREEVEKACADLGYSGGIRITVYVPLGEETAKKTFNPYIGIIGGISILGTSGIVEPKSLDALKKSLLVEMKVVKAAGEESLIITPGNYGEAFIAKYPGLAGKSCVKCANFIGDCIDYASQLGFKRVVLVGHIGKFVKLAGGIMNTHSRTADCRCEIFAAYAALSGANAEIIERLMNSVTSDDCLDILESAGLMDAVLDRLIGRMQYHAERRAAGAFEIGTVTFSNVRGVLRVSEEAERIIKEIGEA